MANAAAWPGGTSTSSRTRPGGPARAAAELLEVLLPQCQPAFHGSRFADAHELSDRLGPQPEGMSRRDHVAPETLRNQPATVDGDRAAQAAMAVPRAAKKVP